MVMIIVMKCKFSETEEIDKKNKNNCISNSWILNKKESLPTELERALKSSDPL